MADITSALGFRQLLATTFANNSNFFYFATLHGAGGSALTSATVSYAGSGSGELATANGYTAGGKTCGTASVDSNTKVDTPDVVWTASGAGIGPVSYVALWCNTTNSITGAYLVAVKDSSSSPQTASSGQTMTVSIADLISF